MLPVYLVVGLLNIFTQHHNYGIKYDPNFDIRVRRSTQEHTKVSPFNLRNNEENNLKRDKRYAYYKKTRITNNDISRYNNNSTENNNNRSQNLQNRYDIFNPNWNFLFNTTKNNRNGANNSNTINNRPIIISSYPYAYPPGYTPKTNSGTGVYRTTTSAYRNQNSNTPYFYNYQNPTGQNFAGFVGYAANKSGEVGSHMPYAPRYSPRPNTTDINTNALWHNALAPYPPNYTQKPVTNIYNNMPSSYTTTNNSGIHNLPYGTNLTNGVYNNNFNNIPKPFEKINLSPYAPNYNNGSPINNNGSPNYNNSSPNYNYGSPNYNNGSPNYNNGSPNYNNGSPNNNNGYLNYNNGSSNFKNGSYAPFNNTNRTVTTTEKIINACVICNIPCPQFMRRFGQFCVGENDADDY